MTTNVIQVPVTAFTSREDFIQKIHEAVAEKGVALKGIFYNKSSMLKGEIEIIVDEPKSNIERYERPSKFKVGATSRYYCVYKKGNKWTYKFVRKNEKYLGETYDTELQAALAYDRHVYKVDGHTLKTNFPERLVK